MPDIFTAPNNHKQPEDSENISQNLGSENTDSKKANFGLLSAYIKNPTKFHFAYQEKGEAIKILARRHFITNLLWISIALFALLLPPVFYLLWLFNLFPFFSLPFTFNLILLAFYYILIFGFAFYNFIAWFYNIGIITSKRMVDIDFLHLSYIDIAITQLEEIEDVVHRQKGFMASFFDYGDVVAHTVTGKEDFVFEKIPHPTTVADILSKLIGDKK